MQGTLTPIAFYSKWLKPAQRKYSAFDRELLVSYEAIRHFRYFIERREFFVLTDHKPHTQANRQPHSPRVDRQLGFISEFTTNIRHIRGKEKKNAVAGTLSRSAPGISSLSAFTTDSAVNPAALAAASEGDDELQSIRSGPSFL